ncbi:MAG: hypothetical protein IJJ60_05170, partial [Clostridia bacterium]|nr:hypothetical protein [Clostridia bacterium]
LTGTMPNRGAVTGVISTTDGRYTVPQGYHDGSGSVGIGLQGAHFIGRALGGAVRLGAQLAHLTGGVVQLGLYAVLSGNRYPQRNGRSDHKDAQYGDEFFHGTDSSFNCFGGSIIRGRFAVPPVRLTYRIPRMKLERVSSADSIRRLRYYSFARKPDPSYRPFRADLAHPE